MKNIAKAIGISLPISTKDTVEVCNLLRGKNTEDSKKILEKVIEGKLPVPYKRYNHNVPHKKGKISSGRYPKKVSMHILKLIDVAEANAQNKGLIAPFKIKKMIANKGPKQWHYGRQTRIKMKRTHVEIILSETKKKEKKVEKKKVVEKSKIIDNTKKETKK